MNDRPATLDQLERWMQSVLMHPGDVEEGLASPEASTHLPLRSYELEQVVTRSKAQSSADRLEIYVNAYRMRLMECLRAEFSATCQAVGGEVFDAMVFGYLQAYPSRSYTLGQLGAQFPTFVAESSIHFHAFPSGSAPCWGEFVIELARWERLVAEVFDGPGSEAAPGLPAVGLERLRSGNWANLRLRLTPDLRLSTFTHPVHRYWRGVRSGAIPSPPMRGLTRLAIYRRDYSVTECELSEEQISLLEQIAEGATLQHAVAVLLSDRSPTAAKPSERQIFTWFAEWSGRGFFADAIAVPPD
jgi:hypothetical protein